MRLSELDYEKLTEKQQHDLVIKDVYYGALDLKREKELKRQERREAIKARLKEINLKRLMIIGIISGFILIIGIIMSFTMIQTTIIDEGSNYTKREIENMVMDGLLEHNSLYLFFKYRYAEQEKMNI